MSDAHTTPARGGDELREAADRLLQATDARASHGRDHVPSMREEQEARWVLRSALASTDMAGAGDDADRRELDRLLSDWRKSLANPSSWLDRLRAFFAAPPVEGLTSGEHYAAIAECAFDDRPRSRVGHPSQMDWEDGYREGTQAAAKAIRAASPSAGDHHQP
ncbi:hypothetical protein LS48_14680, partial [Aequorivita aquimaris]